MFYFILCKKNEKSKLIIRIIFICSKKDTMIKLKNLLMEQNNTDFSKEIFADLTAKGFTMESFKNLNAEYDETVEFTKDNMKLLFGKNSNPGFTLVEIYFPFKVDITDMGSDSISPNLAKTFIPYDSDNKSLSDKYNAVETIYFDHWKAESILGLHDLNLVTLGASKETTPIYKYLSDLIKLGNIATKWNTFNSASRKDQFKIMAQDVKSMAKPGIDKAKQAVQNLFNRNKQTPTSTQQ